VGLLLGAILFAAAQRVVWDVRISGNESLSDRAVEESLAACGLGVGTPLRGFRADVTANNVLLYDDRLAWLSINRKGTVAYVEVREAVKRPPTDPDTPCDLVAAEGGVIERVELEAGNVRVMAGQTVGKGEILVSGLYDSTQQGIRFTTARAKVFARTTRILTVKIPLAYEYKVYETDLFEGDGGVDCEKSLFFFGNHIKFKKKTGNWTVCCDIIENEKSCGILDGVGFPVSLRTTWYLPYTVTRATRTYAEAEELAYFELAKAIAALPGGAELIRKEITLHHGADALTLTCTLTAIEDIATERIIEIES
jgi:sporulation protein YqfD